MTQPPRPNPPGWFHVMNRGARRRDIFLDDGDREFFLRLLAGVRKRFDVRVVSYCLMGNHYHLVLHCPEPALSTSMQWLGSKYVKAFNTKHGFDGPLWRSRFRSIEICDDAQLITVVRYIHRNPLDLSANADLAAYEWSSHSAYLGLRREPWWLDIDVPMALFSHDRRAFQRTVETALLSDSVANRRSAAGLNPDDAGQPTSIVRDAADVEKAVAETASVELREVRLHGAGHANQLREAALVISADHLMMTVDRLAEAFGYGSHATLRSALARARRRTLTDLDFAAFIRTVIAAIEPDRAA